MAQQHINVGTTANDGTGDVHRVAFQKCEDNFTELYATMDSGIGEAPIDGNIYGRKDADWEQITGSGSIPTLQQVTDEGNEIVSSDGLSKLVINEAEIKYYSRTTTGDPWVKVSEYTQAGIQININNEFGTDVKFEIDPFVGLKVYDSSGNEIILTPTSATKNGVEFATEDYALKRDGSNANSDVDLGNYILKAKTIKIGGATSMEVKSDNLSGDKTAQWQDKHYTGIADITDIPTQLSELDDDATHRLVTDTEKTTWNGKQDALGFTPFKFVQTSQTAHTGTVSKTILATATITGGKLPTNDLLNAIYGINKTGTGGAYTIRIEVNTTNTISGATQIAIFTAGGSSAQVTKLIRSFSLNGGNLYGFPFASNNVTDVINQGGALSSTTYNTDNDLYVFFTAQLVNAGDSLIPNLCSITNN